MRIALACAVVVFPTLVTSCGPISEPVDPQRTAQARVGERQPSPDALPTTSLACGAQITGSIRLDYDLTCAGNALLVNGDGITVDLNGHTLAGSGTGNGITVTGSHGVTISGGTVKGFLSGIFASSSTDLLIRDNEFSANREAVLLQATSGSVIKHNTATNHAMRAFMIRPNTSGGLSTNNVVIGNLVVDTPTGIYLIRQPGNTIQENTIVGSAIAGIDLAEGASGVSDNIVRANHLMGGGAGIRFAAGWIDNTFVGNRIEANTCGIKGSTTGNTLTGNVFSGNAAESCP